MKYSELGNSDYHYQTPRIRHVQDEGAGKSHSTVLHSTFANYVAMFRLMQPSVSLSA